MMMKKKKKNYTVLNELLHQFDGFSPAIDAVLLKQADICIHI